MVNQSKLTFLLVALFALVFAAACADTTFPAPQESGIEVGSGGPNENESLLLPPVIVVAPGCDPYTDLNWCQGGGDCMMGSVSDDQHRLSGCLDDPPGGGGTPTCPYWDPTCATGGGGAGPAGPCDPTIDPTCYKPLTGQDSSAIAAALAQYLRPLSAIPDATARQECENMRNAFTTLYTNGYIFRGAYNTEPGDPGAVAHTGAYDPTTGRIHIDPKYLDAAATGSVAALRELMDILLHESAHALGKQHPAGFLTTQWGPVYSDPYFNRLSPGGNSCLNW